MSYFAPSLPSERQCEAGIQILKKTIFPRISGSCQCRSLSSSSPGSSHIKIRTETATRTQRKGNRIRLTKQQLSTWITLFCTFLCRRCTTTTWTCLISRFEEDVTDKNTTLFLFSWTSIQSFKIQLLKKFANIWRNERDGISAIKFQREHTF